MQLSVSNEISALSHLIIHRPDDGIEWVTPQKAIEYLYDDIVYLKKMREEHDVFTNVLRCFIGYHQVLDIENLLQEVLSNLKVKADLIDIICRFENKTEYIPLLSQLPNKELSYTLLTGIISSSGKQIFGPIANYIFCRDIAVVINSHILITEAAKQARKRESIITRYVVNNASVFAHFKKITLSSTNVFLDTNHNNKQLLSIEGGDVMMIHPNHLLIGHSERTNLEAIDALKKKLFEDGVVKSITVATLPKDRFCMHIDTLITLIDVNKAVGYEHLIKNKNLEVVQYFSDNKTILPHASLFDFLQKIFPNFMLIPCGGGVEPFASREQWTDGCNLFTIKPSVALTYDRNEKTLDTLQKYGYKIIRAKELIKELENGTRKIDTIKNTIITIPSNELSRARGGTHCLTLPIGRT